MQSGEGRMNEEKRKEFYEKKLEELSHQLNTTDQRHTKSILDIILSIKALEEIIAMFDQK